MNRLDLCTTWIDAENAIANLGLELEESRIHRWKVSTSINMLKNTIKTIHTWEPPLGSLEYRASRLLLVELYDRSPIFQPLDVFSQGTHTRKTIKRINQSPKNIVAVTHWVLEFFVCWIICWSRRYIREHTFALIARQPNSCAHLVQRKEVSRARERKKVDGEKNFNSHGKNPDDEILTKTIKCWRKSSAAFVFAALTRWVSGAPFSFFLVKEGFPFQTLKVIKHEFCPFFFF